MNKVKHQFADFQILTRSNYRSVISEITLSCKSSLLVFREYFPTGFIVVVSFIHGLSEFTKHYNHG